MKVIVAALIAFMFTAGIGIPSARADGLTECTESHDKLQAEAEKSIGMISDKVPLGPYESASTVLQFVDSSLKGVDTPMNCAEIMAAYVMGRTHGSIDAPTGPGLR